MKRMEQPGGKVWAAEAPDWAGNSVPHLNIAIHVPTIISRAARGLTWQLGQMYGVLGTGLIMARHVYRGLKRNMY